MKHTEIRKKFIDFFKKRGHIELESASLVPENDPSALFNSAGVQPLVPYILQGFHPSGRRLASIQKCVRTTDIEEVGDKTHATFFEMLGNWSIGDYFKEEAIQWSFELLTSGPDEEKGEAGFGLDPERLYITVFAGDDNAPTDDEAVECWKKVGIPPERIYYLTEDNWWSPGSDGPCGPCTEMFYDITEEGLGDLTPQEFAAADERQQVVEVWNDVFMEYEKKDGRVIGRLKHRHVDTGAGLERLLVVLQGVSDIYSTDLLKPLKDRALKIASRQASANIVTDHFRAAVFLTAEGVHPSNSDQGYVLRRLLRRAILKTDDRKLNTEDVNDLVTKVGEIYGSVYPDLVQRQQTVVDILNEEVGKFARTLETGLRALERLIDKNGGIANFYPDGDLLFDLYQSYGFPWELSIEELNNQRASAGLDRLDTAGLRERFEAKMEDHRLRSQTATAGKFKGGLGGHSRQEVLYHTATHLLHAALRRVLGSEVRQRGSNINPERLRFDFSFKEKLTQEQKEEVEKLVNDWIEEDLPVLREEMTLKEAYENDAIGIYEGGENDLVSVYSIGDTPGQVVSREVCGGPHAERTRELGVFRIRKEEAVSSGVRRIKAVLQ